MFTGLVESLGSVADVRAEPPGRRLVIRAPEVARDLALGASVAVSGCCLTVVAAGDELLEFEAGAETLSRTTLGRLSAGSAVNLERSLRLGGELGGHLVTGHVDGLGILLERRDEGPWSTMWFEAPDELMCQMASKGSISVDGVSLTLVDVDRNRFSVAIIPHTLAVTTLDNLRVADHVNLETDLLAKYVQRHLEAMTVKRS